MSSPAPEPLRVAVLPPHGEDSLTAQVLRLLAELPGVECVDPTEPASLVLNLSPAEPPRLPVPPKHGVWSLRLSPRGRFLRQATFEQTTANGSHVPARLILPAALPDSDALALLAEAPARLCRMLLDGTGLPASSAPPQDLPPAGLAASLATRLQNALLTEIWQVGLVHAPIHRFLDPAFEPSVQWLPNAHSHHFYADPFLAPAGEQGLRILVEEYDYRSDPVGRIGQLFARGPAFEPPALRLFPSPTHMSYPFLFSAGGSLCCIPESWHQRRIRLHRLDPQTGQWDDGVTLIPDLAAVDSTVVQFNGMWWLFCTEKGPGVDCRLLLYYAPRLEGPWLPHRANPVKVDIRSARPGGTPFLAGGSLYRPAQDCSESYGCRLSLNRIQTLTPASFEESVVRLIAPPRHWPCRDGIHTLSGAGDWTILDAKRMTFLPSLAARRILHKLRRLGRFAGD